jgi:hypothetical protein
MTVTNVKSTRTFVLNQVGIISKVPLWLRMAILYPNATADAAVFSSWDENATPVTTEQLVSTATTTDPYIQSAGNFTSGKVTVGDVIKITYSASGSNNNTYLVTVRDGGNGQVTVASDPAMAADSAKLYSWKIWTPTVEFKLLSYNATGVLLPAVLDFGDKGRWFPNLELASLSSSAVVHLWIH